MSQKAGFAKDFGARGAEAGVLRLGKTNQAVEVFHGDDSRCAEQKQVVQVL